MEVYNDYNSDLTNLFRCVRDRPLALIQELGFFPLNGREEFDYLKRFLNREEFMAPGLWYQDEGHLAEQCLTPEACGEIRPILEERAGMYDVKRAACFYQLIRYSYGSGCISYGCQPFDIRRTFGLLWEEAGGWPVLWWKTRILRHLYGSMTGRMPFLLRPALLQNGRALRSGVPPGGPCTAP